MNDPKCVKRLWCMLVTDHTGPCKSSARARAEDNSIGSSHNSACVCAHNVPLSAHCTLCAQGTAGYGKQPYIDDELAAVPEMCAYPEDCGRNRRPAAARCRACFTPRLDEHATTGDMRVGKDVGKCVHGKGPNEDCADCRFGVLYEPPPPSAIEKVHHPAHYGGDTTYEVIKVLEAWLTPEEFIGALKFNIVKYQARANRKGGTEDLEKSHTYSQFLVDFCRRKGIKKV